jgi:hypothetical protein
MFDSGHGHAVASFPLVIMTVAGSNLRATRETTSQQSALRITVTMVITDQ